MTAPTLDLFDHDFGKGRGMRGKWTHCLRGHELAGDNLYVHRNGKRQCRECTRIREAARKAANPDGKPTSSPRGIGEAYVVDTAALAVVIERFIAKWEKDRPYSGKFGDPGCGFEGPVNWIAREAGIPCRKVGGIRRVESKYTNMSRADAILQAIGDGTRMEGELEPFPNPRWSEKRWNAYMNDKGRA